MRPLDSFIGSLSLVPLAVLLTSAQQDVCGNGWVEVVVSPVASKQELRRLQVAWSVPSWAPGDRVGLGVGQAPEATAWQALAPRPDGLITTTISEDRHLEEPHYSPRCLGYWAIYWRANQTEPWLLSCLMTTPRWMEENQAYLRDLPLRKAFLPGTHDSAAFQIVYSPYLPSRYEKYTYAQDETIMEQLVNGARHLDLRVGYYDGVWWANHGILRVRPLDTVIYDIKHFLNNTQEILVLDFHRFPAGFKNSSVHDKFVKYLKDELGQWAADAQMTWSAPLGRLWAAGTRLVISYSDQAAVSRYPQLLWPGVVQRWANVRELPKLKEYLDNILSDPSKVPRTGWAAMAELTPNTFSVITDQDGGLRNLAAKSNPSVTQWFSQSWGKRANMVAVDFLRSTGIVRTAIQWNKWNSQGVDCA